MDKTTKYSYFLLIYIQHVDTRLVNLFYDDIQAILNEHIYKVNNYYGKKVFHYSGIESSIGIHSRVSNDEFFSLFCQKDYYSQSKELLDFSKILYEEYSKKHILSKDFEFMIPKDSFLYNFINFTYYAFVHKNYKLSIEYINSMIKQYDSIPSLHLLKVRMLFRSFYATFGYRRFNEYAQSLDGNKFLRGTEYYLECEKEIQLCYSLNPKNKVIDLFYGRILLHLHDSRALDLLMSEGLYTKYEKFINTWLLVYYARKDDFEMVQKYLQKNHKTDTYSQIIVMSTKVYMWKKLGYVDNIEVFLKSCNRIDIIIKKEHILSIEMGELFHPSLSDFVCANIGSKLIIPLNTGQDIFDYDYNQIYKYISKQLSKDFNSYGDIKAQYVCIISL